MNKSIGRILKNLSKKSKAFTIVELLVVIVIIGILAALSIVSYTGITNRANIASVKSDLANSSKRLELYYVMYDKYPTMSAPDSNGIICPTSPVDNNYCLQPTEGTDYNFTLDPDPNIAFILIATRGSIVYYITKGIPPTPIGQVTGIAAISGSAQVGQTLTAGAVSPAGATVNYQWQNADTLNGTYSNISGATNNTYNVQASDNGKYFKVSVTGKGLYTGTQISSATSQTMTNITGIAAISGSAQVGQTLTAGAVSPAGATVNYQWQSSDTLNGTYVNIAGATSNTYTVAQGVTGKYIKVVATGGGTYSGSQISAATVQVISPLIAIAAITGIAQVGQTLTAGAVSPAGATVGYQWQSATTSGGIYTNISGANASTYVLPLNLIGKYLKVVVTGNGNYTGSQTSSATVAIASDGNWIAVGSQVWAKKNLNVGTMISRFSGQTNNAILEKYCYYDNESNCTTYGALYQWGETMQYSLSEGAQGICPAGSHVPTDNDWKILEVQLGMTQSQADLSGYRGTDQGTKLKVGGSSGLDMPLPGYRGTDGSTNGSNLNTRTYIWTSTRSATAWRRYLDSTFATVVRDQFDEAVGMSVRCIAN